MSFQTVSEWIEQRADEMVQVQAELTRRPALGPEYGGTGEWEKARFLEGYLSQCGLKPVSHYDCPDDRVPEGSRPNLAITLRGRTRKPQVCVMTHIDIVPPGEQMPDGSWKGWQSDPYELRREGDRIYGRGVDDNQQPMVASIFALRALHELGIQPPLPVTLLFVSEEETGSDYGLSYVLDRYPELFSKNDIILVPDGGNEDGSMIEVAEKSLLWLNFYVEGRQSHGSMPHKGVNTFRAASHLVCWLDEGLKERFSRDAPLYDPPYSTFEPTMHAANVPNVNTIPGKDHFCFDCRILPEFALDEILDYIRSQCRRNDEEFGTTSRVEILRWVDAPPPTPADAPVVARLKAAISEVHGVEGKPMGIGGSTVALMFREKGYPVAVCTRTDGTAHQVNEYCRVSNMVGDAKVFAHLFLQEP